MGLGALAKSWKSGSGSQGFHIDGFGKETHKKIVASTALAKSWKSGSGGQGSQIDRFDTIVKNFMRKSYASGDYPESGFPASRQQEASTAKPAKSESGGQG